MIWCRYEKWYALQVAALRTTFGCSLVAQLFGLEVVLELHAADDQPAFSIVFQLAKTFKSSALRGGFRRDERNEPRQVSVVAELANAHSRDEFLEGAHVDARKVVRGGDDQHLWIAR